MKHLCWLLLSACAAQSTVDAGVTCSPRTLGCSSATGGLLETPIRVDERCHITTAVAELTVTSAALVVKNDGTTWARLCGATGDTGTFVFDGGAQYCRSFTGLLTDPVVAAAAAAPCP